MRPLLRLPLFLLVLLAVSTIPLSAAPPSGPPRLVGDISHTTVDLVHDVWTLGRLGDHAYFAARGPVLGHTVWRTDGTAAGTEPLADLCPGPCGPNFLGPFAAGETRAYFVASYQRERDTFHELWTTDGTREGTRRVLRLDGPATTIRDLGTVGDTLYFAAGDFGTSPGFELWTSDGTATGTRRFADLCPGRCSSDPRSPTAYGDDVVFFAHTPETGLELWKADPATGTTELVRDICPGECGLASDLAVVDGLIYFSAFHPDTGTEPWVSDGTEAGTRLLVDGRPGSNGAGLNQVFSFDGTVYVALAFPELGTPQIFRTDGTPAGTVPATEIDDALRGHLGVSFATPMNPRLLYFSSTTDPDGFDQTLRVFDPSTGQVRDLRDGLGFTFASFLAVSRPGSDTIVFSAHEQGFGSEPWISDGTAAGTVRLLDVAPGFGSSEPGPFVGLGDRVVFPAFDEDDLAHLWTTDWTSAGTVRVPLDPASPSFPSSLTPFAGRLWFSAHFGEVPELWRTTADGASVERVAPGLTARELTAAGGRLFFQGVDGVPLTLDPADLAPVVLAHTRGAQRFTAGPGGLVYFGTRGQGQELWATDGTPAGTRRVIDVDPDWFDPCTLDDECPPGFEELAVSYPDQLTPLGDFLYFTAVPPGDEIFLPTLWRTDGSAAGTEPVAGGPEGVKTVVSLGGRIVFHVDVPGTSGIQQIWTVAPGGSPQALADFGTPPDGGRIGRLTAIQGTAYYFAEAGGTVGLFRTGGTPATSRKIANLPGASRIAHVGEIVGTGSRLFFPVFTPGTGTELWTSDGTATGTRMVRDLFPGRGDSNPTSLTPVGAHLVFAADDGEHGHEPWVTDGTASGTVLLADLAPGPRPSSPDEITWVGSSLYFEADDGSGRGLELWALDAGGNASDETPAEVPDDAVGILAPEYPDFRFWVRISAGGQALPVRRDLLCIPETVCVSGALPGRSELFLRIVGPRPNGFLWPILVRFTTSRIDVWIEQASTGVLRHYVLDAATPGSSNLDGLFDRQGFRVD